MLLWVVVFFRDGCFFGRMLDSEEVVGFGFGEAFGFEEELLSFYRGVFNGFVFEEFGSCLD